jgi:hypothetical protein
MRGREEKQQRKEKKEKKEKQEFYGGSPLKIDFLRLKKDKNSKLKRCPPAKCAMKSSASRRASPSSAPTPSVPTKRVRPATNGTSLTKATKNPIA